MAPNAGNIAVPADGFYFIELDTKALTYTMTPAEVCLIGDLNGWNTDAAPAMSKADGDACKLTYTGTFTGTGFKFIINPKTTGWAYNYGGAFDNIEFNAGNLPAPTASTPWSSTSPPCPTPQPSSNIKVSL